ncbi:MAG: hypothetical protein E6J54_17130 [Deltaproteobacteria bacterium]|nr:MAG: hypothetical protein E6J54_17130 [Deltaproteobacteria bacterium]
MKEPDLVVERATVVRLLARKALDAGVEIRAGCKLVNLEPGDGGVAVTIRDTHRGRVEEFKTQTLIGADGMSSRVAKIATGNGHAKRSSSFPAERGRTPLGYGSNREISLTFTG